MSIRIFRPANYQLGDFTIRYAEQKGESVVLLRKGGVHFTAEEDSAEASAEVSVAN